MAEVMADPSGASACLSPNTARRPPVRDRPKAERLISLTKSSGQASFRAPPAVTLSVQGLSPASRDRSIFTPKSSPLESLGSVSAGSRAAKRGFFRVAPPVDISPLSADSLISGL